MLRTPLWGVLDILMREDRYLIIEVVEYIERKQLFKKYGFTLRLIDGMNFVQKIPFFYKNEEFIEKYNLYLYDRKLPSYQKYLELMHNQQIKFLKK